MVSICVSEKAKWELNVETMKWTKRGLLYYFMIWSRLAFVFPSFSRPQAKSNKGNPGWLWKHKEKLLYILAVVNCKHNSTDKEINAYSTIIVTKLMISTTDDVEILH